MPTVVFLATWITIPLGPCAALLVVLAVVAVVRRRRLDAALPLGPLLLPIIAIAGLWTVFAGLGHWVYANADWVVRDAVLRDLVVDPWPVHYAIDGVDFLMRAPIGYFLPAALVGRAFGLDAGEFALFAWTVLGVAIVFAMMLRDRPPLPRALVRIVIFIAFSGMDVVGQYLHLKPVQLGEHLEWWAFLFQYSSQTTQLFWVPNHALPGWIAVAWMVSQEDRPASTTVAILFVLFAPLWSPLTAIGIAPLAAVVIVRQWIGDGLRRAASSLLDWRMLVPLAACLMLVYPYLVAGGDQVASGSNADARWVGEDFFARYVEFLAIECAGFAILLLRRDPRDALVWMGVLVLALLPIYRFGPYNDLAMRGSIPALTLLAIRMGEWLSTRMVFKRDGIARIVGIVLLVIGAVTPLMEFVRAFGTPWSLNPAASLIDVTRGTHYITESDRPWIKRVLRPPAGP